MSKIANLDFGDFPLLLAPMEDVSDPPFRMLCKELGADLVYSCINAATNSYRVELTLYRDCTPASQADFDQDVTLFFFNGNTGQREFTRDIQRNFNIQQF